MTTFLIADGTTITGDVAEYLTDESGTQMVLIRIRNTRVCRRFPLTSLSVAL